MKFFPKHRQVIPYYRWFAWHPVWAWDDGKKHETLGVVWLEMVWRRQNDKTSLNRYTYAVKLNEN